ncbi:MAG: hypothetical protein KKG75_01665 [Nanoarchaeota archaeon]|nr:hypothetical protein [Nanoarchaeota archaeon]
MEDWDFETYGFKVINWRFPEDDVPHCEVVLKLNTSIEKKDEETYSFSGTPLPWDGELSFLENLRKSIDLAIKEIKEKTKHNLENQT